MVEQKTIVYKKYRDNRRMWCETESLYATIQHVLDHVLAGNRVEVYMAEGRAKRHKGAPTTDVTAYVLADALHLKEHTNPTLSPGELIALIRGQLRLPAQAGR